MARRDGMTRLDFLRALTATGAATLFGGCSLPVWAKNRLALNASTLRAYGLTLDEQVRAAELAAWREKFAAAGLRTGFHNHQVELTTKFADGSCPLDAFEKAGVDFELDVGHATLAGADPVAWLQRLAGRVPSIHAKPGGGRAVGGPDDRNDWRTLLPEAAASGAKWAVVECEARRNTFEDVAASAAYLKGIL